MQAHGRIIHRTGAVTGFVVHGSTFYVGDFALVRAEQGPARIAQLRGLYSCDPIRVRVQLLGACVGSCGLATTRRAQGRALFFLRCLPHSLLFFSFFVIVTCSSRTRPRVYHSMMCSLRAVLYCDLVFYMDSWTPLGAGYFYCKYHLLGRVPASWDERELFEEIAGIDAKPVHLCSRTASRMWCRSASTVRRTSSGLSTRLRVPVR
jgi:hypothetical protein